MHTHAADKPGVGAAAKDVAEHASKLGRLEFELAALELKRKAGALGAGVGLAVAAGVVGFLAIVFLLATLAGVLAIFLDAWLALLLIAVGLLGLAAVLGLVGLARIKRGSPPVPEQAIAEAKLTTEALRGDGGA
jgi:hypothetical protein